jgi:hypothetical protein
MAWNLLAHSRWFSLFRKKRLERELIAAITIAVLSHRAMMQKRTIPPLRAHAHAPEKSRSPWIVAGRARQHQSWPPQRK